MTSSNRRPSTKSYKSNSYDSFESFETYNTLETESTAPTSISASLHAPIKDTTHIKPKQPGCQEDLSPSTSCCPRASIDTFDSELASWEELAREDDIQCCDHDIDIPPMPMYTHEVADPSIRPSTPHDFAKLFPSMNRLSVRHDDYTTDGNLNLRVDAVVPDRRRVTLQLFHLRMYNLARREFSLRRYCRDSGREVFNSKRPCVELAPEHGAHIQRSVTTALKTLTRTNSGFSGKNKDSSRRPASSHSSSTHQAQRDSSVLSEMSRQSLSLDQPKQHTTARALNTIKLEFSNYAHVDITRRGSHNSKHYDFEWWGNRYHWKRVADKNLGSVSFHLLRHGSKTPIAHIVPETRDPNQIYIDEEAGGWIPPCHMWISDQKLLDAATDVADVVISTGLIALVDDCIKQRWQHKPKGHYRMPLPISPKALGLEYHGSKAFMQSLFHRGGSDSNNSSTRIRRPLSAVY